MARLSQRIHRIVTDVLVAGLGNVFFGDDGFGSEVANRLAEDAPAGATVGDFGIRALYLGYVLLASFDLCIVVDCVRRGGAPGTLYLAEPDINGRVGDLGDVRGMHLATVFSTVRAFGGSLPRTLVVGCEPADVEQRIGLSPDVARAVRPALDLIRDLIKREELARKSSDVSLTGNAGDEARRPGTGEHPAD